MTDNCEAPIDPTEVLEEVAAEWDPSKMSDAAGIVDWARHILGHVTTLGHGPLDPTAFLIGFLEGANACTEGINTMTEKSTITALWAEAGGAEHFQDFVAVGITQMGAAMALVILGREPEVPAEPEVIPAPDLEA